MKNIYCPYELPAPGFPTDFSGLLTKQRLSRPIPGSSRNILNTLLMWAIHDTHMNFYNLLLSYQSIT